MEGTDCEVCLKLDEQAVIDHKICRLKGDLETLFETEEQNIFLKYVTAFMNTAGGGTIYIHAEKPQLLEEFDKKVDQRLRNLITDNRQFGEHFERSFKDKQHVLFRIRPRLPNAKISTFLFSMKTSLNSCMLDQSQGEVIKLLEKATSTDQTADLVLATQCVVDIEKDKEVQVDIAGVRAILQEGTRVQAKDVDRHKDPKGLRDVPEFNNIWDGEQKLRDFISAFASVPGGGSWYSGIREERMEEKNTTEASTSASLSTSATTAASTSASPSTSATTAASTSASPSTSAKKKKKFKPKCFVAKGYKINTRKKAEFRAEVQSRTKTQMLWIGKKLQQNPVEVIFHPVRGGEDADLHVMEVKVKPFNGLCFKYKAGPKAYHVPIKQGSSGACCEAFELDVWLSELCGERLPTQVPEYDNEPMEVDSPTS